MQNIVPQVDDGVIIAQGLLDGRSAVVVAIEGRFQGGSIGEVSGSKIVAALQLTRRDCEQGRFRTPVLLMETGGVRLQDANLGLALIAEIHAEIIALRELVPVVCVIAGEVGAFGGMSIAAALCSYVLMTPRGRLGLNGPEVIEQEAGADEFDAGDREMVRPLRGGSQRVRTGIADVLLQDDMKAIREEILACLHNGVRAVHRSSEVERYLRLLESQEAPKAREAEPVASLFEKYAEPPAGEQVQR